jgi:hypothetical protein
METRPGPGQVLASLSLDSKGILIFTRTGSRSEGAREVKTDVTEILESEVWIVHLSWGPDEMAISARDGASKA